MSSDSTSKSSESCRERAGFLFAHDCARPVSLHCMSCSKAICEGHAHNSGQRMLCTGCYRSLLQQGPDGAISGPAPRVQDLSPLLFSAYYYQGYFGRSAWDELQQDPNDFTEADGAALRKPEEEPPFEKDMQGS